jgi:S-disulfanyl-L-cysteine oxidoreductase SoxD
MGARFRSSPFLFLIGLACVAGLFAADPAPPSAVPAKSAWDGVFSREQVERGRKIYNSECARCHGDTLGGGEDSPALVGKEFIGNWDGKSLGKLVEYTREEMPSDGPGKITRKQSTELAALMLSLNGFPAGQTDLPPDLDTLKQIVITPKK